MMKQIIRMSCLILLFLLVSAMTAFAGPEEVRETQGDAGITFISDGEESEPEQPKSQGARPPGPGGGGPDGKWVTLPQTGSAGSGASQAAGATLLAGAVLALVFTARREKESNYFCYQEQEQ